MITTSRLRELAMRFHVDEPLPFSVFVRNVAQHMSPYQLRQEQTSVRAKLRAAQNHELRITACCRFNVYAAERYAPRTRPAKLLLKEAQLKASARFFLFTERLPCLVLRRISVLVVASRLDSNYVKTSFLS